MKLKKVLDNLILKGIENSEEEYRRALNWIYYSSDIFKLVDTVEKISNQDKEVLELLYLNKHFVTEYRSNSNPSILPIFQFDNIDDLVKYAHNIFKNNNLRLRDINEMYISGEHIHLEYSEYKRYHEMKYSKESLLKLLILNCNEQMKDKLLVAIDVHNLFYSNEESSSIKSSKFERQITQYLISLKEFVEKNTFNKTIDIESFDFV